MTREDVIRMAREAGLCAWTVPPDERVAEWILFAELVSAAERQSRREVECMAECMDMVRQDLIAAGIIDKAVPPMMLPEAVAGALRAAVAAEREACAQVCEAIPKMQAAFGNVEMQDACAEAIRARGKDGQ